MKQFSKIMMILRLLLLIAILLAAQPVQADTHTGQSKNVAIIGSPGITSGGTLPTTGTPGELGDFTFTNLLPANVNAGNLANYDTVVLNVYSSQIACNVANKLSSEAKSDLNAWVDNGGKNVNGFSGPVHTYAKVGSLLPCGKKVVDITLTPASATNDVGQTHTVTAEVLDDVNQPQAGMLVSFAVISGPNNGATGTCDSADCKTDANGKVSFTYTGSGGTGLDEIQGCFTNNKSTKKCDKATKKWIQQIQQPD